MYITVNDNLDLACSLIEKTAAEKSIQEIDDALAAAYLARKKHRERTGGQPFYDMAVYAASHYPSTLPDPLRLKPGGLLPHQVRVYEDFARISRPMSAANVPGVVAASGAVSVATAGGVPRMMQQQPGQAARGVEQLATAYGQMGIANPASAAAAASGDDAGQPSGNVNQMALDKFGVRSFIMWRYIRYSLLTT